MRLSLKLLLISELVLLVAELVLVVPVWRAMRGQIIENMQNELLAIASAAALEVDGDMHDSIRGPDDAGSDSFRRLRDQLEQVRSVNNVAALEADLASGRFITLIYGVLESGGKFQYANAGHGPAFVVRNESVEPLESHSPPIGVVADFDDNEPLQSTIELSPGDRLFLASDGLNEGRNPDGVQFGVEQIKQAVHDRSLDCRAVIKRLTDAFQRHIARPRSDDDVTMLCIDRR